MRRSVIATAAAALVLAASAAAGLPHAGTFVPGRSLGGIRIGESPHAVRATLGTFYGVCTDCARTTWYFTYREFDRHGLGVEFVAGRVSAVYTLWRPGGWHSANGLRLGASPLAVEKQVGFIRTITCARYDARVADGAKTRTAYYLFRGSLWGFGLFRLGHDPCR
jgi:hypothetical protein